MTRVLFALGFVAAVAAPSAAQKIVITGGTHDEANVVVSAKLTPGGSTTPNTVTLPDGTHIPAQVAAGSLPGDKDVGQYLVFVLPMVKAGQTIEVTPTMLNHMKAPPQFQFTDTPGESSDLAYNGRHVIRYFNPPHNPKDHYYTFKPFHHVYDPVEGKTLLTNGSAKTDKDGLYPHHRGLFYGWNIIRYDGKTVDIWHGKDNVFSQHDKTLATEAGEVLGRQRSLISWHGKDGQTFATEQRELTTYAVPGGTLIDFASLLKTDRKSVKLDGDPQHAGFHFRANMEVSKRGKETYYLRPDGKGKPGETRNWEAKNQDSKTINLPWDAASFMVGEKRYTVLRVNHPDNPKEARGSERDYGRFGDYFEYELTPNKPLKVKYRVWVQEGEMTVEQCEAIHQAFVNPPTTKVVSGG